MNKREIWTSKKVVANTHGVKDMNGFNTSIHPVHQDVDLTALDQLFTLPVVWFRRANQRRQLAGLDEHLLKDIGISYEDAQVESSKPFWVK